MHDVGAEDVDGVKFKDLRTPADFFPETAVQVQGSCFVLDEMVTSVASRDENYGPAVAQDTKGETREWLAFSFFKGSKTESRVTGGSMSDRQGCISLSPSYPKAAMLQKKLF